MDTHCNPLLQANISAPPHAGPIPRARVGAVLVQGRAVHLLSIDRDGAVAMVGFLQKGQLGLTTYLYL